MKRKNMKKKKHSKKNKKIIEKKNLKVLNYGDFVIIRNRSVVSVSVFAFIILTLCIACGAALKDAWQMPIFKLVFAFIIAITLCSLASVLLNKIVLDSPNIQMTVYNPFKKQYKFDEINYVDLKSSKAKDGIVLHKVSVYIGDGRRSVDIVTMSSKQADELVSLLRGMLENGAMVFPEGDEEPFTFDDDKEKKKRTPFLGLIKKLNDDHEDETSQLIGKKEKRELPVFKSDRDAADDKNKKQSDDSESDEEMIGEKFILKDSVDHNS